jgi:hypothetical protein
MRFSTISNISLQLARLPAGERHTYWLERNWFVGRSGGNYERMNEGSCNWDFTEDYRPKNQRTIWTRSSISLS